MCKKKLILYLRTTTNSLLLSVNASYLLGSNKLWLSREKGKKNFKPNILSGFKRRFKLKWKYIDSLQIMWIDAHAHAHAQSSPIDKTFDCLVGQDWTFACAPFLCVLDTSGRLCKDSWIVFVAWSCLFYRFRNYVNRIPCVSLMIKMFIIADVIWIRVVLLLGLCFCFFFCNSREKTKRNDGEGFVFWA